MKFVQGIPVAISIVLLAMGLSAWVDVRSERAYAQQLEVETTLLDMIRLRQELSSMLLLAALEQNPLRHSNYQARFIDLKQEGETLMVTMKGTSMAPEIEAMQADHARFHGVEIEAIALMQAAQWEPARLLLYSDSYRLNQKIFAINADTAVMTLKGSHSVQRLGLDRLRIYAQTFIVLSLLLLLWVYRQYLRSMRAELARLKESESGLAASQRELRRLASHQQDQREAGLKELAQEIHDELGQRLTVLRMDLAMLPREVLPDAATLLPQKTKELKSSIDGILDIVRDISGKLRPAALEVGLSAAAESLVQEFRETLQIPCEFDNRLPAGMVIGEVQATATFRILQESLTNVARHAQASHIQVSLALADNRLILKVEDDGKGFAGTPTGSFGLSGMRERMLALGGTCSITSRPGAGTTVHAQMPL